MAEGVIPTELIQPTLSKELVKAFFGRMKDEDPNRHRVFKIRSRTNFYRDSADEDNMGHIGRLVEKVGVGERIGIKPETEQDYYVFMAVGEFEKLYGKRPEKVQVRNVGKAVNFIPTIEPIYYKKPSSNEITRLAIDDLFYVFLNPLAVSWVNPEDLPAYNPEFTKAS